MSTINFTCPHCSFSTQLASNTEGMKGNCPSCKAEVVITADIPEPMWFVKSNGLNSGTPTKLNEPQIISLIRDERIAGGANLSDCSELDQKWISLKDSHFYQYVEEAKELKLAQKQLKKEEIAEEKERGDEHDDESLQNSDISNAIGCLVILGLFLVAAYFIRNWVISVDGDKGFAPLTDLFDLGFGLDGATCGMFLCIGGVLGSVVIFIMMAAQQTLSDVKETFTGEGIEQNEGEMNCMMIVLMVCFLAIGVSVIILLVTRYT